MIGLYSKKKGFTLVEILIVLAVISMVVLIGVSSYGTVRKKIRLDIAANSLQSTIVEARDKTRAGYYSSEDSVSVSDSASICFGFSIKKGEFVNFLSAGYDRLKPEGSKCDKANAVQALLKDNEKDIIVKDLFIYEDDSADEVVIFFAPPNANIEIENTFSSGDKPELKVVLGYIDSDEDLNKREVVFNLLTGSVYSQPFKKDDE